MELKKFCHLLLKKNLLSRSQLDEALSIYRTFRSTGVHKPLRDILVEKEFITPEDLANLGIRVGKYKLMSFLGKGNTATVYKARQLSTGRVVALKIMTDRRQSSGKYQERFKREVETILKLKHPNLIQGFDYGEEGASRYFSMEYIEGQSLRDILDEKGRLEEDYALYVTEEIARALDYIEERQLVHRDIKPDNIMIVPPEGVKLCDLGLAKWIGGEEASQTLTQAGAIVGTPYYVSPEIIKGEPNLDIRSDIYSLGATLYHLLLGKPPFQGPSAPVVFNLHLLEKIPPYREVKDEISRNVYYLLKKMMKKDPQKRQQTASELVADIQAVRAGEMPTGYEHLASFSSSPEKSGLSVKLLLALGGIFLLANITVAYFILSQPKSPEKNSTSSSGEDTTDQPQSLSPRERQVAQTLAEVRKKLKEPSPPHWKLYQTLRNLLADHSKSSQREEIEKLVQSLAQKPEVKRSITLGKKLDQLIARWKKNPDQSWDIYRETKRLKEEYSSSPLVTRVKQFEKTLLERPEVATKKEVHLSLKKLKAREKGGTKNLWPSYLDLLQKTQRDEDLLKSTAFYQEIKDTLHRLSQKKAIKKELSFYYLKTLHKMTEEKRKKVQKFFLKNKSLTIQTVPKFLVENYQDLTSKEKKFYQKFFKKYPLPTLEITEAKRVLRAKYKWEQGLMLHPSVCKVGNVYYLIYVCGKGTFPGNKIAMATSRDGIQWGNRKVLLETPSWIPGKKGNHYKNYLAFDWPTMAYNPYTNEWNIFVEITWGGGLTRYILRYTSKDGRNWKVERNSRHIVTTPKVPYHSPTLITLQGGGFLFWASRHMSELQMFPMEKGKISPPRKAFKNDGFQYSFAILPWNSGGLLLYYYNEKKNRREYRLSPNGVDWWGHGRLRPDAKSQKRLDYTPSIRGFIIDPKTNKYRLYFHQKRGIYSALLSIPQ